MTDEKRRAWSIVASMFVTVGIIWGLGFDIIGVYYHALFHEFGWSRERFSLLSTAFSASFAIGVPLVGWLLDRVAAQIVIGAGALTVAGALVGAASAHSFAALMAAYFVLGLGNSAASVMPASLVINNWFYEGRGTAMGVTLSGLPVGEMTLAWLSSYMIQAYGWRAAYLALGAIVVVIVVPLVLLTVRTRPQSAGPARSVAEAARALPGYEVGPALRTRSFNMLCLMFFCYGLSISVALVHEVPFLSGIGYSPARAATIWGFLLGSTLLTRPLMGYLADWIGNRAALMLSFMTYGLGMIAELGAGEPVWFGLFALCFAFTMGAPAVILPVLVCEQLGLRRYGTLLGLMNILASVGLGIGPVVAGRVFDLTRSYDGAFMVAAAVSVAAAVATLLCTAPAPALAEAPAPAARGAI
jgi:MFS family permease